MCYLFSIKGTYIAKDEDMDRETLLKIINIGSLPLSLEEIEKIMDEEMEKDPNEMDAALIELCADILEKAYFENGKPETSVGSEKDKRKRIKLIRVLILAAIILILFSIAIPACAKYIKSDVSDQIVKFYSDHFEIELRGENNEAINYSDENSDIIKLLNEKGIENVILPAEILKEEYVKEITHFDDYEGYITTTVGFENESNGIKGYVAIIKHSTNETGFIIGQNYIRSNYNYVKQFTLNGKDILVFSNNEESYIEYIDSNIKYQVYINNCDFDSTIEIAKTLE